MADVTSVTGLVRLHLDDVDADVFTDALLITFVNSAYRQLQQALAINGSSTLKQTTPPFNVAAGATTMLPPSDQWLPIKMWEKAEGDVNSAFVPMRLVERLPDSEAGDALRYWKYENGVISFIGATRGNDVKMQYVIRLAALTAPTSEIEIPLAEDYLAFMTAAYAARSRGEQELAGDFVEMANVHLKELLSGHVRFEQQKNFRARPYGWR